MTARSGGGAGSPSESELTAAIRSTYVAFALNGFAFASWASRIPQVKGHLGLSAAALGGVLLSIAAGSLISLPLSGPLVARFGSRRTVTGTSALAGAGVVTAAIGVDVGVWLVVVGLLALGLGNGAWDVAMNVHGADVERRLGRAIMPRFHAGFSLGTVAGAAIGVAMVAAGVSVTAHLTAAGLVVAIGVPTGVQRFLRDGDGKSARAGHRRRALTAWRERRTLLIGVVGFTFAFSEGAGNDWLSVGIIEAHRVAAAVGALAFATFLAAETTARWFGPAVLDRHGRVAVVRWLCVLASGGLLLFALAPDAPLAFVAAIMWGAGVSLGFPVAFIAGADDAAMAAPRVSVVASIGYCGFLGGPPLIGFLAQQLTVAHAIAVAIGLLAIAALVANALRQPTDE